MEIEEIETSYTKKQKAIRLGMCSTCGKRNPEGENKTCKECIDAKNKRLKRYIEKNRCLQCPAVATEGKRLCPSCRDRANEKTKRRQQFIVKTLLMAYGGKCACCGLDDIRFLTLDHIKNDGAERRRRLFGKSQGTAPMEYRLLYRMGCPPGIVRVLCYNCNMGRQRFGGDLCPHEMDRQAKEVAA